MNTASLSNKMDELREPSSTNNTHLIEISEIRIPQFTDQELAIPRMFWFRSDGNEGGATMYLRSCL